MESNNNTKIEKLKQKLQRHKILIFLVTTISFFLALIYIENYPKPSIRRQISVEAIFFD